MAYTRPHKLTQDSPLRATKGLSQYPSPFNCTAVAPANTRMLKIVYFICIRGLDTLSQVYTLAPIKTKQSIVSENGRGGSRSNI